MTYPSRAYIDRRGLFETGDGGAGEISWGCDHTGTAADIAHSLPHTKDFLGYGSVCYPTGMAELAKELQLFDGLVIVVKIVHLGEYQNTR